jgi:hypothetical protein
MGAAARGRPHHRQAPARVFRSPQLNVDGRSPMPVTIADAKYSADYKGIVYKTTVGQRTMVQNARGRSRISERERCCLARIHAVDQ